MSANKKSMPTDWIDPDDAPELTDAFFVQADEYIGTKLIARGRPKSSTTNKPITVRYDADVIAAFRATGKGWQTRMNQALKEWLKTHSLA